MKKIFCLLFLAVLFLFTSCNEERSGYDVNGSSLSTSSPSASNEGFTSENSSYYDKIIAADFTWKIEGTTLYLDGHGLMPNYKISTFSYAPWYGEPITEIKIADTLTSIGNGAFYELDYIETITLHDNIKYIGSSAFLGCSKLKSITIPDSVRTIGGFAFSGCYKMSDVNLMNGIEKIDDGAFYDCSGLEEIVIPDSVTSIGKRCFENCYNLKSIELSRNLSVINERTFMILSSEKDGSLSTITIPRNVTFIGENAFYSQTLESVVYEGTKEEWGKILGNTKISRVIKCTDGDITN